VRGLRGLRDRRLGRVAESSTWRKSRRLVPRITVDRLRPGRMRLDRQRLLCREDRRQEREPALELGVD
jgi:hypothetical protein